MDKDLKVKFGMKAIIALDREYGINLMDQVSLGKIENSPSSVVKLLWAGLQRYHSELTLDDIENLLDDASYDEVQKVLEEAFARSSEDEAKKKPEKEATASDQ